MMNTSDTECGRARERIARAMRRIYERGMTTTSGGNISLRFDDDHLLITPAGLDKGALTPEQIALVDRQGAPVDGPPASSELPTHLRLHGQRPDLHAIVHGHPPALVAFSVCHETPDLSMLPAARRICGRVGFAPYELTGTDRLAQRIADVFRDGADNAVLENHGVVVGGRTLDEARTRFEALESAARINLLARRLGAADHRECEADRAARPPHGPRAPSQRPSADPRLAGELCDLVRRADRHRLINALGGAISARLDRDRFLITPTPLDPGSIAPDDVRSLSLRCGDDELGVEAAVHRAIYRRHDAVGSVITGAPIHATAFAITDTLLDTRTIPESYILLRQVADVPLAAAEPDPAELAATISPARPAAVLRHRGVLILGDTPLRAFDRLEVLDATARALIDARSLAGLHPMRESALGELDDLVRRMFPDD